MDKIEDLSKTENAAGKVIEPVTIDNDDYETLDIEDPLVWLYLAPKENKGLITRIFLSFLLFS